ncbi:cuticlin-2-like [Strigops habroptila]|uniref:cuticlin-2-like n=1 Tax=Strigops habroptila TaxID=2489341 RepID=UPI0011CF0DB6|nr:cuticlin-2-like [Strigops habroptila]
MALLLPVPGRAEVSGGRQASARPVPSPAACPRAATLPRLSPLVKNGGEPGAGRSPEATAPGQLHRSRTTAAPRGAAPAAPPAAGGPAREDGLPLTRRLLRSLMVGPCTRRSQESWGCYATAARGHGAERDGGREEGAGRGGPEALPSPAASGPAPGLSPPAVGGGHFTEEWSRGALLLAAAAAAAATATERRSLTGGHSLCVWAGKRKRRL